MSDATPPRRHRALREDVIERRLGRGAIAPLSLKLPTWHAKAALLAARLNHLLLKGAPADLIPDVEATIAEVESGLSEWRLQLSHNDRTGRVADAERAGASILNALADVRSRAYRAI